MDLAEQASSESYSATRHLPVTLSASEQYRNDGDN